MTSRIVLIGQAPGRDGDPLRPLVGGVSGTRLQALTGLNLMQYCRRFERMNVFDRYPGPAGKKGDRFPMMEARLSAFEIRKSFADRVVVFVGLGVAEAFDAISPRAFEWRMYAPGFRGAPIPHTSPVNLFWNDAANVDRARRFFDELLGRS